MSTTPGTVTEPRRTPAGGCSRGARNPFTVGTGEYADAIIEQLGA
ncbi:MAG TPA: hypothetical protein VLR26_08375 [Frankiaceae bacterium]|nr:hypothetical protein [Frankiaceae bacterium]